MKLQSSLFLNRFFFFIEIRRYLLCLKRDRDTENRTETQFIFVENAIKFCQEVILQVVLRLHRYMLKWFSREFII